MHVHAYNFDKGDFIMDHLFSPYKIKGLDLKNRITMPPMCQYSVEKRMELLLTGITYTM